MHFLKEKQKGKALLFDLTIKIIDLKYKNCIFQKHSDGPEMTLLCHGL